MTYQNNLEISGNLRDYSTAELLVEIARAKLNGSLRLSNGAEQKSVFYFDAGDAVFAVSNARRFRLLELLTSENKISKEQIAALPDAANDAALRENLMKAGLLQKPEIDALVAKQITLILRDVFGWSGAGGEWAFNPLVRVKGDVRFQTDAAALLVQHARSLPDEIVAAKFKRPRETFSVKTPAPAGVNLLPEEAFVYTRFESAALDIEEASMFSGLPAPAALRIVYTLWLAGFLTRGDWSAPFSERWLDAVRSANLTLKKAETPAATKIDAPKIAAPLDKIKTVNDLPVQEKLPEQKVLTLDEYLARIEIAASHYAVFDVERDAPAPEIKRAYFALAKRFHPDLFQREVAADRFKQIQNAFTRTAQAYETLKNEKSREVYDYKMRKELAEAKSNDAGANGKSAEERSLHVRTERAAEDFENGFGYLMDENFVDALPFLARAVHLIDDNARYRAYYGKALSTDARHKHKAEAEMQAAIRLEPNNADYRLMLAEFFASVNLPKRAEGELNRLLTISPENAEAKRLLDDLAKR